MKIPCKQCDNCGFYNDFTIDVCECGHDVSHLPAQLMEWNDIPGERFGIINENLPFYVQKCSACGTLNFTSDPNNRVSICQNCHKTRVSSIVPILYVEEDTDNSSSVGNTDVSNTNNPNTDFSSQNDVQSMFTQPSFFSPSTEDDDFDDENDENVLRWKNMLGNVEKAANEANNQFVMNNNEIQNNFVNDASSYPPPQPQSNMNMTDDEEISWDNILQNNTNFSSNASDNSFSNTFDYGNSSQQVNDNMFTQNMGQTQSIPKREKDITLTAIRFGNYSFTISPKNTTSYLLGRSANQSQFLSQDLRVSNQHCYLLYRDGEWYVRDNHSSNGTAVNSQDIGLNGECILKSGDELKLGHHPDSMAFRITIA